VNEKLVNSLIKITGFFFFSGVSNFICMVYEKFIEELNFMGCLFKVLRVLFWLNILSSFWMLRN
jgi:hypothetical protein